MTTTHDSNGSNTFVFAGGVVEFIRSEILYRDGGRCSLSKLEAELLFYLIRRPGVPVTRDELLLHVWKVNPICTLTRTVDMHVSNLRRKLRDAGRQPSLLLTVNGQGYMLARSHGMGGETAA
jgi:DNA-binding response OmpR family regulator